MPANAAASTDSLRHSNLPWWIFLIEGILAIVIGILLLVKPGMTTAVIARVMGIYWLLAGLLAIVSIFLNRANWGLKLGGGLLGIIAGLIVVRHPLWSAVLLPTTVVLIIGAIGVVIGILNVIQAFRGGGWGIGIVGALSALFGIYLLLNPVLAALTVVILLGITGVVGGVIAIIHAFRVR